jgi:hypothetical protein
LQLVAGGNTRFVPSDVPALERQMSEDVQNVPWIVVPLSAHEKMTLRNWIARTATSAAADKALETEGTSILKASFDRHGLVYDEDKNGPVATNTLRFWHGQEGVAVPEALFIRPDNRLARVSLPLNAYLEGVGDAPKQALGPLWEKRTPESEKPARDFVSLEGTKFHWLVGAKDPEAINPDNWILDQALLDRPGTQDYQVDLLENYKTNIALYPEWQAACGARCQRSATALQLLGATCRSIKSRPKPISSFSRSLAGMDLSELTSPSVLIAWATSERISLDISR